MQAALATQLARDGSALKSGGSVENVANNIERQGLNALHRKDFNYQTKLKDLHIQRMELSLVRGVLLSFHPTTLEGF